MNLLAKKWVFIWIFILGILSSIIIILNFIVDPMWTFGHTNKFNFKQHYINERQQKTNYIYFNGLNKYDGVMFGSSRTTFINQDDFVEMKIYNYALDSMYPFEYIDYLDFAKRIKSKDFEYIIIGADFFSTRLPNDIELIEPQYFINESESFLYRWKNLFNYELFKRSINNIKLNFGTDTKMYYLRNNIKVQNKVSEQERINRYKTNIVRHTSKFVGNNYIWNEEYFEILQKMQRDNPNTKFIIFTPPVSADLFVSIIINGDKFSEYSQWLRGLIDIFGDIYCFMDINSITKELQNYPDDDHFYPYIGKKLAYRLSTNDFTQNEQDFGMIVNKDNIDIFLANQLDKIQKYEFSSDYPYDEMYKMLNKTSY